MVPRRDGEHSQIVAGDAQDDPLEPDAGLKGPYAHQMDSQEGNDVPVLKETLPGLRQNGTVAIIDEAIHVGDALCYQG